MIRVVLYARMASELGSRLQEVILGSISTEILETCRTIETLSQALRQPQYDLAAAVLLAEDTADLSDLLSIADLLDEVRIILVLPDRKKETIAKGHTLKPRFLTYADSTLLDLAAVLNRMLSRAKHPDRETTKAQEGDNLGKETYNASGMEDGSR